MKLSNALLGLAALTHSINAVAVPDTHAVAIDTRTPEPELETRSDLATLQDLYKRKGGGGGGRGGSGSGGSSGGGGRGGGSSSGGGGGGSGRGGGYVLFITQHPSFFAHSVYQLSLS